MRSEASTSGGRISGLDGLRAVSIALVLGSHLKGTAGFPDAPRWFATLLLNGSLGVSVFFVISGFLITSLLVREHERTSAIDFRLFYIRRALRIFPAYYVLVAVIAGLWAAGALALSRGEFVGMLTYTRNFVDHGAWQTGHLWSLAIEEQFYLLWPFVLWRLGPARAPLAAAAIVACAPFARLATWYLLPEHRLLIDWYTFTRIDSIMFGCLLALVHRAPWFVRSVTRFYARGGAVLALLVVVASVYLREWTPYDVLASYTVEGAGIALLIHWCVTHPASRVGRVLELAPLRRIGDLSYSLYLWQQLFLNRYSHSPLCRFPLNILLAIGVALASRALIENPFLRLKERFEPRRAPRATAGAATAPAASVTRPSLA